VVCDLRSQSNNTVSDLVIFENFPNSSGYTIYDSLPSVSSISIAGLDSDGVSLGNNMPLHLGTNSVLLVTLSSTRSLSGTFYLSLFFLSLHPHQQNKKNRYMHTQLWRHLSSGKQCCELHNHNKSELSTVFVVSTRGRIGYEYYLRHIDLL
jgi:hypothetical protein